MAAPSRQNGGDTTQEHEAGEDFLFDGSVDSKASLPQLSRKSLTHRRGANVASARMDWQAKQKETIANYRGSVGATQAQGGQTRTTLATKQLYFRDVQLVRKMPAPASRATNQNTHNAQLQVHREVELFFKQLCPKLTMQVTCLCDQVDDDRNALHAIIEFDSAASAQHALRTIRRAGHKDSAQGPRHLSWRYCGLAWEPETFCSGALGGPSAISAVLNSTPITNLVPSSMMNSTGKGPSRATDCNLSRVFCAPGAPPTYSCQSLRGLPILSHRAYG